MQVSLWIFVFKHAKTLCIVHSRTFSNDIKPRRISRSFYETKREFSFENEEAFYLRFNWDIHMKHGCNVGLMWVEWDADVRLNPVKYKSITGRKRSIARQRARKRAKQKEGAIYCCMNDDCFACFFFFNSDFMCASVCDKIIYNSNWIWFVAYQSLSARWLCAIFAICTH